MFLRRCHDDFGRAITLLDDAAMLEANDDLPKRISGHLHQYAVVIYFRPFTRADTRFEHKRRDGEAEKKISLGWGFIPKELLPLHRELRKYRNSAYAHSDIAVTNPRLRFWRGSPLEFPIAFSPVDKKPLHIHRTSIKQLCQAGLEWTTQEIRNMEEQFRVLYPEE